MGDDIKERLAEPPTRQEQVSELMGYATRFIWHYQGRPGSKGRVLRILKRNGAMTQNELTKILEIRPSSVSEILTKLEARGLITRKRDERDKRRCVVDITEAGRENLRDHEIARDRLKSRLYDCLDVSEQEELIRILLKLRANWETLPGGANVRDGGQTGAERGVGNTADNTGETSNKAEVQGE